MSFSSMESKNKFVNNVISRIYDPSIHDDHASEKFWLDTGKVFPIIAHMFPSFVFEWLFKELSYYEKVVYNY